MNSAIDLSLYKTSSAGTHVESNIDQLEVKYEYTWVGWFFITFFGTTQIPTKISFYCKKTNELFEELTEKESIKHYIFYRKK